MRFKDAVAIIYPYGSFAQGGRMKNLFNPAAHIKNHAKDGYAGKHKKQTGCYAEYICYHGFWFWLLGLCNYLAIRRGAHSSYIFYRL